MSTGAVALVAALVFAWGISSGRVRRAHLTAPLVFVALGLVVHAVTSADPQLEAETVRLLAEAALVWVLFSDASGIDRVQLRADAGVYGRLLGLALPLTVLLGWLVAWGLFPGFDVWLALLVAAALAPTDAALGAGIITNPAVPARIRAIVNVESGLNDGIVTPIVLIAIAGASAAYGYGGGGWPHAVIGLLVGTAVGIGVGALGGHGVRRARESGWVDEKFVGPGVLALALLAYAASLLVQGNGFVAAFAAGIAFGRFAGRGAERQMWYVEGSASLASLLVWFSLGVAAIPIVADTIDWRVLLYAVLSLTVIRMLPVALALLGSGLGRQTSLFLGWFGPRGLASVVFGLLALETLGTTAHTAGAVITTTVLLSVLLQGVTSESLANRYAAAVGR